MKLIDFLKLVPETQSIMIILDDLQIEGSCDSVMAFFSDDVLYKTKLINAEATNNTLKIWIEEREGDEPNAE